MLDNAPAYLNFLAAAMGLKGMQLNPAGVHAFAQQHGEYLRAVSLGSVFFGACTYIGNGPNFMVKAIAESAGARARILRLHFQIHAADLDSDLRAGMVDIPGVICSTLNVSLYYI